MASVSLGNVTLDVFGLINTIASQTNTSLATTDKIYQSAASIASIKSGVSPGPLTSVVSIFVAGLAYASGRQVLLNAIQTGESRNNIEADFATIGGDLTLMFGSMLSLAGQATETPAAQTLARGLDGISAMLTGAGLAFQNNLISSVPTNAITTDIALLSTAAAAITTELAATANNPLSGAWSSVQTALQTTLNAMASAISSTDNTTFMQYATTAANSLATLQTSFGNFYDAVVTNNPLFTSTTTQQQSSALSTLVDSYQQAGYYIVQSGDTASSIVSTLSNGGITSNAISATTLTQINAAFGITALTTGAQLHVPVGNPITPAPGADLPLPMLPSGRTYVYDPSTGKVFTVGSSLDGHDSGALIIDTPVFSGFASFAKGTYSGFTLQTNGNVAVDLTTTSGIALGTLSFNPSSDAGTLTTLDGLSFPISVSAAAHLTSLTGTPEQVLLGDLSALGNSLTATQLNQNNDNFLNPSATPVTVQGSVGGDFFTQHALGNPSAELFSSTTNDAIINGSTSVAVNVLRASGDMVGDTITNMQVLEAGTDLSHLNLTLTASQFNSFAYVTNGGGGPAVTLTIAGGGTVSLQSPSVVPNPAFGQFAANFNLVASGWEGTTLIGTNFGSQYSAGQSLTASEFGNDTLIAGNNPGDTLTAGEGIDTLTGSSAGQTTFVANNGLAAGSVVQGSGTGNILQASGDISGATITGVQTLIVEGNLTLSAAEFSGFGSISFTGSAALTVATSGTYNLANETTIAVNMIAGSNSGMTLIGNNANNETLTASQSGNDTLTAGTGTGDHLLAVNSSGNDTLTAGNVTGDTLSVANSSGNNILTVQDILSNNPGANWNNTLNAANSSGNNGLTVGDGSYDLLRTDYSLGTNSLTAGNGSHNWLNAESSAGTNTLVAGSGSNNTLDVSWSYGNNNLSTATGTGDYLNASSSSGNNTLSVGSNSNTLDVSFSSGNNSLSTVNGSSDWLNAESSTGANTLTVGGGNSNTLDVSFSSGNNTATAGNGNGDYLNANSSTGNNILTAGSGANDTFSAVWSTGRNTFNAGTGNTTLFGGEGYTTYKFGSAFGQDVVWNSGSSSGQGASAVQGEIDFTSSATTYENLWFTQSGNDLLVRLLGTADTITVKGWFGSNAGAQVQTFNAGGLTLSNTAVANLVSAMATYQTANSGFNPATATSMPTNTTLQTAMALAWHKYDSVAVNGDGSWTGTLNDHVSGNWTSITDHYSSTDQLTETYELFNNGTATDAAIVSGITLTGNNTVGETITASSTGGDTVSLLSGAMATVNGGSATINLASGSNATLTGSSPDTANMNGTNATFTDASSTTNTINVNATGAAVYASGDTINAATNVSFTDNWGNNTVNLASGDTLTIGQNGDTVTGSNDTLWLNGNMTVTVNGNGNGIWANNGAPNNTVTVNGNSDQVGISTGSVTMVGNNDTVSLGAAGDTATLTGTGEWATASNDTITFGANSTGTVSGNSNSVNVGVGTTATLNSTGGNTIAVTGGGNSVVYDTAGSSDIVNLSGNGTTDDYLILSNAAITIQNNARADTYGSHNTITAGSNDIVGAYYGTNNTVTIGSNSGAWLGNGSSNTVNINGASGGSSVNDSDTSGDTVNVSGNGTNGTADGVTITNGTVAIASNANAYVVGNSDVITASSNDTVGVYGIGDTLTIGANGTVNMGTSGGDTINVTGSGNTVVWDQSSTGDTVNVSGNGAGGNDNYIILSNGTVVYQANARADVYGNGDTITASGNDVLGLHGNNDTVTMGANSGIWVDNSSADTVTLTGSGDGVILNSNVSNFSINGSNATIQAAAGDTFNLTGSNDTVIASNGTMYLNANTTNIAIQGSNEIIHVRSGDTYTITGTGDTVITDTVVTAQNGTTIASYNGTSTLVDVTGLAYDSSITATVVQNSGGFAAQMFVSDHGSVVDTINLQSVQNLGGLTVRPDGSGGTLIVDPPLSLTAQDSVHQSFADAWHTLMGRTDAGASSSHDLGQQCDFSALTPNAPVPEDQHNSLRDFSHQDATLIRDGPGQNTQPTDTVAASAAQPHNYADMKFDFSSLPSMPASDHLDHHLQVFSEYAAALVGDVPAHQIPELSLPTEPDHHLIAAHLAPSHHDWHL